MWTVVNFGKWQGKGLTLPQIILKDPDWFFWALEAKAFKGALSAEALTLAARAKKIKIKKDKPEDWRVEYIIAHDGKFSGFDLIPTDRPPHQGSSSTVRREHLDLSFPRHVQNYDKLGCGLMLKQFKFHWFGKTNARLTKERCEEFFEDASNFL